MRKMKTPLVLLITVLVLTLLAVMPRIVAVISDLCANRQPSSAPMPSIVLQFSESKTLDPGAMLQRLALEQNMNTIPIVAEQALMTEAEAYAAVEKLMQEYCDSGIFDWFDYSHRSAQPYLAMDPDDTTNFGIVWAVNFVHEDDPYENLFVHLDDTTGRILYMDYYTVEERFPPEEQAYVFEPLVTIFLNQLGLMYANDYFGENVDTQVTEQQVGDDGYMVRYTFRDIEYGEIVLEFHVAPHGFYTTMPN